MPYPPGWGNGVRGHGIGEEAYKGFTHTKKADP